MEELNVLLTAYGYNIFVMVVTISLFIANLIVSIKIKRLNDETKGLLKDKKPNIYPKIDDSKLKLFDDIMVEIFKYHFTNDYLVYINQKPNNPMSKKEHQENIDNVIRHVLRSVSKGVLDEVIKKHGGLKEVSDFIGIKYLNKLNSTDYSRYMKGENSLPDVKDYMKNK
jgi:hypothetical protein